MHPVARLLNKPSFYTLPLVFTILLLLIMLIPAKSDAMPVFARKYDMS